MKTKEVLKLLSFVATKQGHQIMINRATVVLAIDKIKEQRDEIKKLKKEVSDLKKQQRGMLAINESLKNENKSLKQRPINFQGQADNVYIPNFDDEALKRFDYIRGYRGYIPIVSRTLKDLDTYSSKKSFNQILKDVIERNCKNETLL